MLRNLVEAARGELVDETIVLRCGGRNDLDTFLAHYHGEATEKAQARERAVVNFGYNGSLGTPFEAEPIRGTDITTVLWLRVNSPVR